MPNFNGDVVFVDGSGQVRSQVGDLTLRADSTNTRDVIVGSGRSLRPDVDFAINLGDTFLRWNNVYATSGVFNTITAHTSGTFVNLDEIDLLPSRDARRALGSLTQRWARIHAASGIFNAIGAPTSGTFIESAASIVPNRTNIYSLGTGNQRWANIFATSGNILTLVSNSINTAILSAGTADIDDLTLRNSLTFPQTPGGGFTINQQGSLLWDAQGFDVAVINMTQWDWGGANLLSIGHVATSTFAASLYAFIENLDVNNGVDILGTTTTQNIFPINDRLYTIGSTALRFARMHAVSGLFNTIGPQTSGTYVNVIGSLVPEIDALYSLGTSSLRWANVYAVSGAFSTRPTVNGSGVLLQGDPGFIANGSIALDITPAHGTDFVLIHGLGSTDWTWSMWRTDVTPIKAIIPKDIRPSGVNAVQVQIDSTISGRLVLTAAGASGVATGAVGMFQTTIDFGSTPIQESGFLITNAFVTPSSILMAQVAYDTTSSKDLDEMEMDGLDLKLGQVNFGGFTIYARALDGPVHGEFKINYSLANI